MRFWRLLDLTYALISGDHERLISGNRHFYVAQVEVWGDPPDRASAFLAEDLRDQTEHLAERVPHLGNPVVLRLHFSQLHRVDRGHPEKHPIPKVIEVTAAVFSADSETELGRTAVAFQYDFTAAARDDGVHNASVINEQTQRAVDSDAADELLERVYGTKDWDRFMHPGLLAY